MSALNFVLTNAGRAAISQVGSLGPVVISQVALGSNGYTATVSQTALQAQIKRLTPAGSSVPTAGTIHITVQDDSADAYTVREIGIYTSTGALFAVYSQTDSILIKASTSVALFALDIVIANVPAGSVTIGNATFQYPPATESVKGVAELATNSEVQTGTDAERIVTPAGLSSRTATESRTGLVELATAAEVQSGIDTQRAITPSGLLNRTATTERTGIVELADSVETQTGTDTTRAVTPAGLASRTATDTRTGIVELATNAETQTGTDTVRAVTPAGLSSRTATTERTGLVELATDTEVATGTDSSRAVTPANLKNSPGSAKAWISIADRRAADTNSPLPTIRGIPYNISTIGLIPAQTGINIFGGIAYQINFLNAIANTNYAISATVDQDMENDPGTPNGDFLVGIYSKQASSCAVRVADWVYGQSGIRCNMIDIVIFGY